MALRLEIISSQHQQLGPQSSIVLGVSGGSVGRALDNDWSLPDPQRYLSGHHARFHSRAGGYYLEDTSSNGVFVNESTTPQGRHGLYALRDGDMLRMGEYRIRVHIDDEGSQAAPGTNTMERMSIDNVVPLRAVGQAADDLGASLNIEALIPQDSADQLAKLNVAALQGEAPALNATLSAQHRLTRLRAAARARLEGKASPLLSLHNGMQAFCRGAGIDPARVPMENEAQSLHLVGRLLREAVIGLKEILRAQQAFRDQYGLAADKPEGRSPLEQGTDEYLLELLNGHERHQFDAVMQLRDCFTHAGDHDAAMDPALRSALGQFMAHLSPARLETGTGGTSAESGWARYKDIYSNLLQTSNEELPHLFLEAIAQSYPDARRKNRA
ncbi:MAG: type VI secretion system-associated FHA domain protein TagH [Steroidobacteraceae bacterium]